MRHTLQWFKNRIGKKIYRLTEACHCKHCQKSFEDGFVLYSKTHADYVYCCQNEMGLKYADKKM